MLGAAAGLILAPAIFFALLWLLPIIAMPACRPFHPIPPPAPKHDREVLMVQPDGRLAWVDDGGMVDFRDVVRRHCERKERERRREMW
jgi:hypothetical protein